MQKREKTTLEKVIELLEICNVEDQVINKASEYLIQELRQLDNRYIEGYNDGLKTKLKSR